MATIPLGQYLWERIHQVGVSKIFGVPGDFNLNLLDHIDSVPGLDWVGNTNELNAGYAADGYARTKHGAGCVVTTHGVGELSAINAIASAMTESIKVIHVVGQTSRPMQKARMMIHHSIGFEPDHQCFNHASKAFRVAAAELYQSEDGEKAAEEIDRVLRECFVKSGPVYVFVPVDLVEVPVSKKRLETPINLEPDYDAKIVKEAAEGILEKLYASKRPALFVDCLTDRHDSVKEVKDLVEKLGILVYSSSMAKGIIDETHPLFLGLYTGAFSGPGIHSAFQASDLILILGNLPSDTNTGGFTRGIAKEKGIYVNAFDVDILGEKKYVATIKAVLRALVEHIQSDKMPKYNKPKLPEAPLEDDHDSKAITQSWVWDHISDNYLQPYDVVFGETGTAQYGMADTTFPDNTQWIAQTYMMSIGYCTPAALGADVALKELAQSKGNSRGRTVLVTGDGSLMLTVQELGNMIKQGLAPVILLINNAGYTIERVIHGAHQSYNDIVPFNYEHMLPFFNMPLEEAKQNFHKCTTRAELEKVLQLESVRAPKTVQVVEIVMDKLDTPWRLNVQLAARGPEIEKEMKDSGFKWRGLERQEAVWSDE